MADDFNISSRTVFFLSVTFSVLYVTVYIVENKSKIEQTYWNLMVARSMRRRFALTSPSRFGMSETFLDGIKSIHRRDVRSVAKRPRPRRGGRLTEERQREIVALVAPLFLEHGYEQVSIDDIVERIGGSKRTLYERFGGKAGLFAIVISEYCASVQRDLFAGVDQNASLEKQLTAIGKNFLSMILHRRILELHRLMVSMGRGFPAVAARFYQLGPISAYGLVAGWIERQQKAGRLAAGDATMLAELFLDMLTGKHQLALLTSSFESTSPEGIARTVKAAAKLFLNGARPAG